MKHDNNLHKVLILPGLLSQLIACGSSEKTEGSPLPPNDQQLPANHQSPSSNDQPPTNDSNKGNTGGNNTAQLLNHCEFTYKTRTHLGFSNSPQKIESTSGAGDYNWQAPTISINTNTLRSSSFSASKDFATPEFPEYEAICQHLSSNLNPLLPLEWKGETTSFAVVNGERYYIKPYFSLSFKAPAIESFEAWEAAGRPDTLPAELSDNSEFLFVFSQRTPSGGEVTELTESLYDSDSLTMACNDGFSLSVELQPYPASGIPTNMDPNNCQYNADKEKNECLTVKVNNTFGQCTFESSKTLVIDAEGGKKHPFALKGQLQAFEKDSFTLTIDAAEVLPAS